MPGAYGGSSSAPSRGPFDDCRSVGNAPVPRASREAGHDGHRPAESRVADVVERPVAGDATGERRQAYFPISWSSWTRGMRRLLPAVVLVGMIFLVVELLPGSAPITQSLLWPFLLLICGPGALLIRESVRRLDRGWASILLLGAAYGIVEEGLALHARPAPERRAADVSCERAATQPCFPRGIRCVTRLACVAGLDMEGRAGVRGLAAGPRSDPRCPGDRRVDGRAASPLGIGVRLE